MDRLLEKWNKVVGHRRPSPSIHTALSVSLATHDDIHSPYFSFRFHIIKTTGHLHILNNLPFNFQLEET